MADYNSDRTGSNIDAVLDKADNLTQAAVGVGGNVGIGASTPACHLEVKGSGNGGVSEHLRITSTDTESKLAFVTTTGTGAIAQTDGELRFMTSGANTERMRIDSSGNVGIGTASPSGKLEVNTGGSAAYFTRIAGDNGVSAAAFAIGTTPTDTRLGNSGNLVFKVGSVGTAANLQPEVARIDSSGNLLVGKTTTNTDSVGFEARATGLNAMVRDGGEALVLGRKTNDGSILSFRKDGTTVGSIGTDIGRIHIGSDDCRLFFDGGGTKAIWPWSDTATLPGDASNTINLGDSLNKFKDLYLSGGVYLGGTGAANKLDDYEEGVFTPTLGGSSSNPTITYSEQFGAYVKVGDLVHVQVRILVDTVSGGLGALSFDGLPFVAYAANPYNSTLNVTRVANFNADYASGMQSIMILNGTTTGYLYRSTDLTGGATTFNTTDIKAGSTIVFSGTYRA